MYRDISTSGRHMKIQEVVSVLLFYIMKRRFPPKSKNNKRRNTIHSFGIRVFGSCSRAFLSVEKSGARCLSLNSLIIVQILVAEFVTLLIQTFF